MKRLFSLAIVFSMLFNLVAFELTAVAEASEKVGEKTGENQVIIEFEPMATATPVMKDSVSAMADEIQQSVPGIDILYRYDKVFSGISAKVPVDSMEKLLELEGVKAVYPDLRYEVNIQESVPHIGAMDVISDSGFTGAGVTIAIIDTGIDYNHPHLKDNFVGGYNLGDNHYPEDDPMDHHGHGTHVAGIAAGGSVYDGVRYRGVAPDADILAYNVLDEDEVIYGSSLIKGIELGVNAGADIINMSVATALTEISLNYPVMRAIDLAVDYGVVVVVPAGNDGNLGRGSIKYPGNTAKGISVGSTGGRSRERNFDLVSDFSSLGPSFFDLEISPHIVAPGGNIMAPEPGGGYTSHSGTSMAAPHVAAAAALLMEKLGEKATPEIIKGILMNTSVILEDPDGDTYSVMAQGAGRIDLKRALEAPIAVVGESYSFGQFESELGGKGRTFFEIKDLRAAMRKAETTKNQGDLELEAKVLGKIGDLDLDYQEKIVIDEGSSKNFEISLDVEADNSLGGEYDGFVSFSKAGEAVAHIPLVLYIDDLEPIFEEEDKDEKDQSLEETTMVITIGSKIYTIDEEKHDFGDVEPFIRNGRTYLPIRAIIEAFDADVTYRGEDRSINIQRGETQVSFKLGKESYTVNGEEREMDVTPYFDKEAERAYLPVRYFGEDVFGAEVEWDPVEGRVILLY